jgi:O-antigen/teichoic acid export membrane protein
MFPLVSERHANGRGYKNLLIASSGLVGIICLLTIGFYFLFPSLIVRLFFGRGFLEATPFLGYFGIFLSLYTLSFLLINFYLSIQKTKAVVLPVMAAVLQVIMIFFFHQNLWQVVWLNIVLVALLFGGLLLFLIKCKARR